jgi:hypothetical protein
MEGLLGNYSSDSENTSEDKLIGGDVSVSVSNKWLVDESESDHESDDNILENGASSETTSDTGQKRIEGKNGSISVDELFKSDTSTESKFLKTNESNVFRIPDAKQNRGFKRARSSNHDLKK